MSRTNPYLTRLQLEPEAAPSDEVDSTKVGTLKQQIKLYRMTRAGQHMLLRAKQGEHEEALYRRLRRAAARTRDNYPELANACFGYVYYSDTGNMRVWRIQ